jgi:hypothetical protein
MKSESFLESDWFMNTVEFVKDLWPDKFRMTAHCVFRVNDCQNQTEMEEAQNASSSENDARGMDVHLGVEGLNSNGHGEEIDKEGNMIKIIERLQKDVQTHRSDNKNLMKAKDQQGEFNIKLIQSMERIEKKLDKDSDSSKSRSHGSPDEKRKSRSVGRHHHHSQGHS